MSYAQDPAYTGAFPSAADAPSVARAEFITKTYVHLTGAIIAFVFLEAFLLHIPGIDGFVGSMIGGRLSWLIVLGAFMGVSYLAERWARSTTSIATQYLGLTVFVAAEAVIFLPLLWVATNFGGPSVIPTAAAATLTIFIALTTIVFVTRKDFSFLRGILWLGGIAAMGFIVLGLIFGFTGGTVFTVAMIAFAGGWVLYDTSNVLHHYRIGQHVSASLALFASIALLFWYVLRFFLNRR